MARDTETVGYNLMPLSSLASLVPFLEILRLGVNSPSERTRQSYLAHTPLVVVFQQEASYKDIPITHSSYSSFRK